MSWWGLVRRRAGSAPARSAGLAAVLFMVCLLLSVALVAAPAVLTAGLRDGIARAPAVSRALEIAVDRDPAAPMRQDAHVRAQVATVLGSADVDVVRVDRGEPLEWRRAGDPVVRDDRAVPRLVPFVSPGMIDRSVVVQGRMPAPRADPVSPRRTT